MGAIIRELLDKDAIELFLQLSRPFFASFITYYFLYKLLPNRLNIFSLIGMSLIYAAWANLRSSELYGTNYHLWMNMFINLFSFFIIFFLFKGPFWRKYIMAYFFEIIKVICETMAFIPIFVTYTLRGYSGGWPQMLSYMEAGSILQLVYTAAVIALFALLGSMTARIWRMLPIGKFHPFYLLFAALPIGQMYSLSNVVHPGMGDWFFGITYMLVDDAELSYSILSLFGAAVCLAVSITMFCYILTHEKRMAVETELRETKRVLELERSRFNDIERQSEELMKIRHDFNNQLASIARLVRIGKDNAAQDLIDALSEEIAGTEEK